MSQIVITFYEEDEHGNIAPIPDSTIKPGAGKARDLINFMRGFGLSKEEAAKAAGTDVIVVGGAGQARIIKDILWTTEIDVKLVFDIYGDNPWPDAHTITYDPEDVIRMENSGIIEKEYLFPASYFILAFGNPYGRRRMDLQEHFMKTYNLFPLSIVHSSVVMEHSVLIARGAQILAKAYIGANVQMGDQCIVNAQSSVDHDCKIGHGSEIGPGAVLCGEVTVGANVWVGAGATIIEKVKIGNDVIIGAGTVVTKDVPDNVIVRGVPAQVVDQYDRWMEKHGRHGPQRNRRASTVNHVKQDDPS